MVFIAKKLKPMKPTLRERKRYLTFEIVSEDHFNDFSGISEEIYEALEDFLGTLGNAEAGILMLEDSWNPQTQHGVIRVNNKHVEKLKTSLMLIENIGKHSVIVKSVKTSGLLKKAKQFASAS